MQLDVLECLDLNVGYFSRHAVWNGGLAANFFLLLKPG
jgi:hypothetical protein